MDTNTDINTETKTNLNRPAVVTIAAILLIVVSLFATGLGIASQYGLLGQGFGGRQVGIGQFRNRTFTPPSGGQFNGFTNNQGTTNQGTTDQGTTPNFTPNRQFGTGLSSILRLLRPVTLGLDILLLVLSAVAAFGLFKSMRWGATLAIVVSILLILLTIPGMIRIFYAVVLVENLARILLAIAVIVLLLLPMARKSYVPARDSDE